MSDDRIQKGMLAKSKAGHDKGKTYIIYEVDDTYVYLVDGTIRKIENPKRKKLRHLQLICEQHDVSGIDDVSIKRILKLFDKEMRRI